MVIKRKRKHKPALSSMRELDGAGLFVHVEDVAGIAGGSRAWVYKLIHAGAFKGVTRVGRQHRIPTVEARRVLKEMGHSASA